MTRKVCKRRHWNLVDPLAHVMQGLAVTPKAKLDKLRLLELSALEAFRTGRATQDDWRSLADLCNVAETLCGMGIGPEAREPCMTAQRALGEVHARFAKTGRLGMAGPELTALREAYDWHDTQRISIGLAVYERAIQKTADRIKSAHPDLKVYITKPTGADAPQEGA